MGWQKGALAFTYETIPDLVLDTRLPDIDGCELCRQWRAHRPAVRISIPFLTQRRKLRDKLAELQLGAVDDITEPFNGRESHLSVRSVPPQSTMEHPSHPTNGLPVRPLSAGRLRELLASSEWAGLSRGCWG